MPLIGNGIKSKKTGKSGLNNRIYQPFCGISKKYAEINTEKVSLSTGPLWDTPYARELRLTNQHFTHFKDIYDLSEQLETRTANEIISSLRHPDYLFSKPDIFVRELAYTYAAQENLINILFSRSRSNMLLNRIENSLKDIIFSLRPEYKENAAANILFTFSIYGGFYAFDKCRHFGKEAVIDSLSEINLEIMKFLQ